MDWANNVKNAINKLLVQNEARISECDSCNADCMSTHLAAQVGVARGGLDLEDAVLDGQQGHVERAACNMRINRSCIMQRREALRSL